MRRVAAVVVSLGVVTGLAGCWPLSGQGSDRQLSTGPGTPFDVDSVGGLTPLWTATFDDVGPRGIGHPVVSDQGGVYVTSARFVRSFEAATGRPRWISNPKTSISTFAELDTQLLVQDRQLLTSVRLADASWEAVFCDVDRGNCNTSGGALPGRLDTLRSPPSGLSSLSNAQGQSPLLQSRFVPLAGGGAAHIASALGGQQTLLTDRANGSRLALGTTQVFHAGIGVGTAPGNGVRAAPITGGAGWATLIDGTNATSPVLSPDETTVYVGTDAGTVWAVSTVDGRVLWTADVGDAVAATPTLADGDLYVPTRAGALVALPAGGCGWPQCNPLWSSFPLGAMTVPPAVSAGVVFTGSADGTVHAFDAGGCGEPYCPALWSHATGSRITGGPEVGLGKLFVGTEDGRLIAYGLPPR